MKAVRGAEPWQALEGNVSIGLEVRLKFEQLDHLSYLVSFRSNEGHLLGHFQQIIKSCPLTKPGHLFGLCDSFPGSRHSFSQGLVCTASRLVRPHLLMLPKQLHQLGTRHSDITAWGGAFSFKLP